MRDNGQDVLVKAVGIVEEHEDLEEIKMRDADIVERFDQAHLEEIKKVFNRMQRDYWDGMVEHVENE